MLRRSPHLLQASQLSFRFNLRSDHGFCYLEMTRKDEDRDAESRHLFIPNEQLDFATRGLVLGKQGQSGTRGLGTDWAPTRL